MRVVFDTNVVISRMLSPRGTPARLFDLWDTETFDLVVSEPILVEYARALAYPKIADRLGLTPDAVAESIGGFRRFAIMVRPTERLQVVKDDPDDDKLLECAIAGGAEYVVSGDEHLLRLGEYRGIQILPSAVFLRLLATENDQGQRSRP